MTRNEYWAGLTRSQVRAARFAARMNATRGQGGNARNWARAAKLAPISWQWAREYTRRGLGAVLAGPRGRLP